MGNKKRNAFLPLIFAFGLLLSACNNTPATPTVNKYTVTWKNDDGSVLEVDKDIEEGTLPTYDGVTPSKAGDAQYSYTFSGWDPEVVAVSADATYTAKYTSSINKYTVTWLNYNGDELEVDRDVEYGTIAHYDGETPERANEGEYSYTFIGWDKDPAAVTGDITYTAKFSESTRKVQITFVDADGTTLQSTEEAYGSLPVFEGTEPTKAGDEASPMYRFIGWDADLSKPVTEDIVITAKYQSYLKEVIVEDFEDIADGPSLRDAGWVALGYSNATGTWTEETAATVSIGTRSEEGKRSLRFDSWENGVGYKIAGTIDASKFTASVNAMKFRMMVPEINNLRVLIYLKPMEYMGKSVVPWFRYNLNKPTSSEFVEYTIPLDDQSWDLWGEGKGLAITAAYDLLGIHQDDIPQYLDRIEFYIEGNDGNGWPYVAFLDSLRFITEPNVVLDKNETLEVYDRYTGKTTQGNIVRIDLLEDNQATAKVIDLEQPITIPGTYKIENKYEITFTSVDEGQSLVYKGRLHNAGKDIKYISAGGSLASVVGEMALNAVQVVNNFEQYTEDGVAYYDSQKDIEKRSGMRGDFYSEYYAGAGNSSPWAGNGWSLMKGDGDQAKLKKDSGAHSGEQYGCFKNSKDNAMRYMQWGLFDGSSEQNSYRGATLGFWAKTNGFVPQFVVRMYSTNAPTQQKMDERMKKAVFDETGSVGEWKHYELQLNPALIYYGFMLFMEKNYIANSYLYIDDIEVYTDDPYATYVAPVIPDKIKANSEFIGKLPGAFNGTIRINDKETARLSIPGLNAFLNGTYTIDEQEISFNFGEGELIYNGTLDALNRKITFKSCSGDRKELVEGVDFNLIDTTENAESYEKDGSMYYQGNTDESKISGARGAYFCDYLSGGSGSPIGGSGWSLMGGNGDQLQLDKTNAYEGSQSLKMKMSTAGKMRYMQWELFKGTAEGHTGYNRFSIFLKNTNDFAMNNVHVRVYYVQQVTSSNVTSTREDAVFDLAAKQDWTECVVKLDPSKTYYGYCIFFDSTEKTGYMNVDYAHYYNEYDNPDLPFYTYDGLELYGEINEANAAIKFANNGKATLVAPGIGIESLEISYEMKMVAGEQIIIFTINGAKVTGEYTSDYSSIISYTVTAVEEALASYIPVGTTFINDK